MSSNKFVFNPSVLTVKVVVAGPGGVGKTTLLKRLETNNYIPAISTVGVNFLILDHEVGETILRVAYWDYAGEDRFKSLFPGYCQGSSAGVVTFDTSRIQTLSEVPTWLSMLKQHNDPDIPVILLGNKIDTINEEEREVVREATIRFVKEYKLSSYYFCSAKTGEGLSSPFAHLGILIIEDHKRKNPK